MKFFDKKKIYIYIEQLDWPMINNNINVVLNLLLFQHRILRLITLKEKIPQALQNETKKDTKDE